MLILPDDKQKFNALSSTSVLLQRPSSFLALCKTSQQYPHRVPSNNLKANRPLQHVNPIIASHTFASAASPPEMTVP
eukprot:10889-Pelagomonas_calceolata.AAC.4